MKYCRKLKQLKRYSKRMKMAKIRSLLLNPQQLLASYFQANGQGQHEPEEQLSEQIVEDEEMEQEDDDFNIADYINSMPMHLKKQFKMNNPQLPELFFMTASEKRKYFDKLNAKFKKDLAKSPKRKISGSKKINFKQMFDVRGFNQNEKVVDIKKSKQLHEKYRNDIHFS